MSGHGHRQTEKTKTKLWSWAEKKDKLLVMGREKQLQLVAQEVLFSSVKRFDLFGTFHSTAPAMIIILSVPNVFDNT